MFSFPLIGIAVLLDQCIQDIENDYRPFIKFSCLITIHGFFVCVDMVKSSGESEKRMFRTHNFGFNMCPLPVPFRIWHFIFRLVKTYKRNKSNAGNTQNGDN
jgi:hypothetical protein